MTLPTARRGAASGPRLGGIGVFDGPFVEAYGLWNELHWAEWFAVISGAVYVPFEVVAVIDHPHWIRFAVLNGNLLVVFYILWILIENRRDREEAESAQPIPAKRMDEAGERMACRQFL